MHTFKMHYDQLLEAQKFRWRFATFVLYEGSSTAIFHLPL